MSHSQKVLATQFFNQVINNLNEGGTYVWPDAKESYVMKNGKFIGSKTAIRKMKEVTTVDFHTNLIVK